MRVVLAHPISYVSKPPAPQAYGPVWNALTHASYRRLAHSFAGQLIAISITIHYLVMGFFQGFLPS